MNKKTVFAVILTALLVLTLVFAYGFSKEKKVANNVKQECTSEIFWNLYYLSERLEFISHSGEYSEKDSEKIQYYLSGLEANVGICSKLSGAKESLSGFSTVARALGNYYSAQHNDVMVQSILYDGKVSADELSFISALYADLNLLLGEMLLENGLGMRDNLSYGDIEEHLSEFLSKWGEWSWNSEAPYDLLNA